MVSFLDGRFAVSKPTFDANGGGTNVPAVGCFGLAAWLAARTGCLDWLLGLAAWAGYFSGRLVLGGVLGLVCLKVGAWN